MKSLFDLGFRKSFMALPRSRATLGQEDPSWDTSASDVPPDQTSEGLPGAVTWQDLQTPSSTPIQPIPGLYTSVDQGPPAESVPGLVTAKDLQESLKNPTPATDWGKLATALVKGAGDSYQAYNKAQSTFNQARAKAGLPAMPLATAAAASSGIDPNVIFLVGGLAAVALVVILARA